MTGFSYFGEALSAKRIDALRLLRQVPAIVSLSVIDDAGRERLYVSRIGLNRIGRRTDRSADEAVAAARSSSVWYGRVRYYGDSEPYLKIAMSGNRPSVGVVIADSVNGRRSLVMLGARSIKGYDEDLLVFRISFEERPPAD